MLVRSLWAFEGNSENPTHRRGAAQLYACTELVEVKIAPIMEEMARYPDRFQQVLVHTGQHYDDEMSQIFFDDLDIPRPDVYLGVGSGSHKEQRSRGAEVNGRVLLRAPAPPPLCTFGGRRKLDACLYAGVR